jgi:hypothetical protein
MGGVRAAGRTEFFDHEFFGLLLLVLAGRIITSFAAIASQTYQISHRPSLLFGPGQLLSVWSNQSWVCPRMPRAAAWILQAHDGIRTRDLFLTKEVLYRLSYMGPDFISAHGSWRDTAYGAGNGIRTRDPELGRLALYQLSYSRPPRKPTPPANHWWRGEDSNLRRHKPADLQSAPFGHSGTSPLQKKQKIRNVSRWATGPSFTDWKLRPTYVHERPND